MIFGSRVALGPIMPPDLGQLFNWTDSVEDARLNETYRPLSWDRQEAFWLGQNDPASVFLAIRIQPHTAIAGFIQIRDIDAVHRTAKIGIRIGEACERGKGYGREALTLAIDYCWNQLNLSRLDLEVFAPNEAAIQLYDALGFEREGRLRQARFIDGQWIDVVLMALLRDDRSGRPSP